MTCSFLANPEYRLYVLEHQIKTDAEAALRALREALKTTVPMTMYAESRIRIAINRLEKYE